jgi:hypothetical protein
MFVELVSNVPAMRTCCYRWLRLHEEELPSLDPQLHKSEEQQRST